MASRRSRAREMALQMLYQQDLNPDVPADVARELIVERLRDEALARFAWSLFAGVMECRPALDAKIADAATHWALNRMAPTDRNVLRLGAFELLYTETPPKVVIDEALELASRRADFFPRPALDAAVSGRYNFILVKSLKPSPSVKTAGGL